MSVTFFECTFSNSERQWWWGEGPFEILFENLTPRVLGESHTHLYTNESIEWIEKKLNIKLVGAWWFGGDIFDLHKSIFMSLSKKVQGDSVLNKFNENFQIIWDSFQKTVDKIIK